MTRRIGRQHELQQGLSLVELLVSLATGLFLLAGVLGIFSSTVGSQGENLKTTRLNQDMRRLMDLVDRDLRRAGYWSLAGYAVRPMGDLTPSGTTGAITLTSTSNAFAPFGAGMVGLEIHSSVDGGKATVTAYNSPNQVTAAVTTDFASTNPITHGWWMIANPFMVSANDVTTNLAGDCLAYSYDRNGDAAVDANERLGFRLHNGEVQMHTGGAINCTDGTGSWTSLTDSDTTTVSALSFDTSGYECVNLTDSPNTDCDPSSGGYTPPDLGDVLLWVRRVDITLAASLTNDPNVARTTNHRLRLRNDALYID